MPHRLGADAQRPGRRDPQEEFSEVDLSQCPVQDMIPNSFLARIKRVAG